MERITFTIRDDHLKLLSRMFVEWDGNEFGAPAIDYKRPYGNSDVYADMCEILGVEYPKSRSERQRFYELHRETRTALQIVLRVGFFRAGEYEADRYEENWKPVRSEPDVETTA